MTGRLEGKVALITGGTSGIGEATVELFLKEGARVLFVGRNADKGASMEKALGPSARFFRADISNEQEVKASIDATVKAFGRLDCLFNNAGGRTGGTVDTITQTDFDEAMNLLLGSVLFGIRYAAPIMAAQGGGSIISNASVAGYRSHMGGYLYSIAKAAVIHSARIAAVQLGASNIRVNTISPSSSAARTSPPPWMRARWTPRWRSWRTTSPRPIRCRPRVFRSISPTARFIWRATTRVSSLARIW